MLSVGSVLCNKPADTCWWDPCCSPACPSLLPLTPRCLPPLVCVCAANGWEGFVLQGFAALLERPADRPPVLALEWNPAAMQAAGWRRPLALLDW